MYSESPIETDLTEFRYNPTNAEIIRMEEKPIITIINGTMNFEDNPRLKVARMKEAKTELKQKMDEGNVKLEDVVNFITQYIT